MSELDPYIQTIDEVIEQLGIDRPPVTVAEMDMADKADVVEAIAQKTEAWGEVISAAMRAVPSVDADVCAQRPRHTPDPHAGA